MGTAGAREVMLGMAENWLIKEPPWQRASLWALLHIH